MLSLYKVKPECGRPSGAMKQECVCIECVCVAHVAAALRGVAIQRGRHLPLARAAAMQHYQPAAPAPPPAPAPTPVSAATAMAHAFARQQQTPLSAALQYAP